MKIMGHASTLSAAIVGHATWTRGTGEWDVASNY